MSDMAQKTHQPAFDANADIRIDFYLIVTAIGAALAALIYLILI
jgi:hypothetical protein